MTSDPGPTVERRIADAFHALATTEVPTTAPRPQQAPRPAAVGRGSRRRRLQIACGALLAVAAAVVVALVLGTEVFEAQHPPVPPGTAVVTTTVPAPSSAVSTPATPTTPSTPPSTSRTDPAPTFQQVTQAFVAVSHPNRSDVVVVPGGYEGADLDDAGTIRFWQTTDGLTWRIAGTSLYPSDNPREGPPAPYTSRITSAGLVAGAAHVTVVVDDGHPSADGTQVSLAYADGPVGWGVVVSGPDGTTQVVADHGAIGSVQHAGMYSQEVTGGQLVTIDCGNGVPDNAACAGPPYRMARYWRWDGSQFVLDH